MISIQMVQDSYYAKVTSAQENFEQVPGAGAVIAPRLQSSARWTQPVSMAGPDLGLLQELTDKLAERPKLTSPPPPPTPPPPLRSLLPLVGVPPPPPLAEMGGCSLARNSRSSCSSCRSLGAGGVQEGEGVQGVCEGVQQLSQPRTRAHPQIKSDQPQPCSWRTSPP